MRKYTIAGTTYYVSESSMYVTKDEQHGLEDIDEHPIHLYESEEYREYLVRLEWGGEIFSQVKIVSLDKDGPPDRHVRVEDFDGATPVESIVPDGLNECPECGAAAGDADDDPMCFRCGYGTPSASD